LPASGLLTIEQAVRMSDNIDYVDLVRQAQLGCQQSQDRLARLVQGKVFAHIYRVTLDRDLAQDLSQETLLEMHESMKRLKFEHVGQLWAWLFRTALSKVQHHYRHQRRRKVLPWAADIETSLQQTFVDENDGLTEMIRRELSAAVAKAVARLNLKQRHVLALRCYEQMPYSQIAGIMDCSELYARALFFRAKHTLKQQLSQHGFDAGLLLAALGLFGRMTSPAQAASIGTPVAVASIEVGIAAASLTVAAALVIGTMAINAGEKLPNRTDVRSVHYVELSSQAQSAAAPASMRRSNGAYEQWYYFPDGIDGPLFMRTQRWDPRQRSRQCDWLRNGQGNYYHFTGEKYPPNPPTVYINNYNIWRGGLQTLRLPSDQPTLTEFLDSVEGETADVICTRDSRTGLLTAMLDYRFIDVPDFNTVCRYNTIRESFFNYNYPADISIRDERDAVHKRGWTWFRVTGEIGPDKLQGGGQMPFIYDALKEHPPWLKLKIADKLEIVDTPSGAYMKSPDGKVIAAYPAGAFFKGLARPWMGMHAVDIVRRDAAESRIRFETHSITDEIVNVTVTQTTGYRDTSLIYRINLPNDLIEEIEFARYGDTGVPNKGRLTFTCLDKLEQFANEFTEPGPLPKSSQTPQPGMGISWLIKLAQDTLDQQQ